MTAADYAVSYDPTWGRFKAITHPAIGNHEGGEGGSNRPTSSYFGAAAGDPSRGYYSFDLGAWHLVALNSNCGEYCFNGSHDGCRTGSAQEQWLRADLAAHPATCTLAYFHVPRFASGSDHHTAPPRTRPSRAVWDDLYAAGVDVVLNGHVHYYERFAPLRPDGTPDPDHGMRDSSWERAGDIHGRIGKPVRGSEMRNNDSFGVLRLTLNPTSYDWAFVNDGTPGATNTDAGSSTCHR